MIDTKSTPFYRKILSIFALNQNFQQLFFTIMPAMTIIDLVIASEAWQSCVPAVTYKIATSLRSSQ